MPAAHDSDVPSLSRGASANGTRLRELFRRWRLPVFSLVAFAVVAVIIDRELGSYHLRDILGAVRRLNPNALWSSLAFTAASYAMLTVYDVLALRYAGKRLPYPQVARASFIAYAFAHNLNLAALTGAAVRYRLYAPFGLTAVDVARVSGFTAVTTALGIALLGGAALLLDPEATGAALRLHPGWAITVGVAALAGVGSYVAWSAVAGRPAEVRGWQIAAPGIRLVLLQISVAVVDFALAAAALWVLLPGDTPLSFAAFCGVFAAAMMLAVVSHVPGGLGVFETIVLFAIPHDDPTALLAALVAYRALYYLIPLAAAAALFAANELAAQVRRMGAAVGLVQQIAPQVIGTLVFLSGIVLLVSGATPGIEERLDTLTTWLPLVVLESSHLAGSVIGLSLLVIARALYQRVDAAYHLTVVLLIAGAVVSLLKGLDYEEATVLTFVLGVVWLGRAQFYRVASLWQERFSPGWIANVAIVLGCSVWIGFLAHRDIPYSHDLWWTFATDANASRMLRASLVVVVLAAAFVLATLLRPAQPRPPLPSRGELDRVRPVIAESGSTLANVALAGDKYLLHAEAGDAFLMYRIAGRSWVALGDPVGPRARWEELIWRFRELADEHGGRTVFYEVGPDSLPLYVDLGLTLFKLGEDARVPLANFSLDGSARAELRTALRRAEREGATFDVVAPADVPALIGALEPVSMQWLEDKATHEKGFSLGFFDPEYLANFPLAVVRRDGVPVAFANLWLSGTRDELSIDLMRFGHDAPYGVMDYLFTKLMLWGREAGYRTFNLGMAPLAGLEQHPLAPAWHRVGNLVFRYGEHFYNFEGLRRYKAKFQPEWQPRYLASPGGLALPRVLIDVSVLISGGVRGIFAK